MHLVNQVSFNLVETYRQLTQRYNLELFSLPTEMSRMGRGCVVYYHAEMEHRLRQDVKDFAAQIVSCT